MTTTLTGTEARLLALYRPIKEHMWGWEREWIDGVLTDGTDAEVADAARYCRDRIDAIQRTHAEREA